MANNRKIIREAIKSILTGNTSAGANVYANRETSLWEAELPAILISTKEEDAIPHSSSSRRFNRTLNIIIEIKTQANEAVDDDLDSLSKEVEDLLSNNQSLNGTVTTATYKGTQISLDAESDTEKGTATLSYEILYIA